MEKEEKNNFVYFVVITLFAILIVSLFVAMEYIVLSTANIAVGNSTITTYTPILGDVVVVHNGGSFTVYNALSNTNLARGQALLDAISNAVNKDSIYLKAETYNLGANSIDLSLGGTGQINLYGAGKYNTIIESSNSLSPVGEIITPGTNTVTADLSIIGTATEGESQLPWGVYNPIVSITNATLRNVYIQAESYGVYVYAGAGEPPNRVLNATIYNLTTNTLYTSIELFLTSVGKISIFDSNLISTASPSINSGAYSTGIMSHSDTNVILVNTSITASGGTVFNYGVQEYCCAHTYVDIYGGTISTSGNNAIDLNNFGTGFGKIEINSTVVYSTINGSITNLGASSFGPYSYLHSPTPQPTITMTSSYQTGQFLNFLPTVTPFIAIVFIFAGFAIVIYAFSKLTEGIRPGSGPGGR